jgi:hypothetical protein
MFSSGALLECLFMISSACHIISKFLRRTWLWKERTKDYKFIIIETIYYRRYLYCIE